MTSIDVAAKLAELANRILRDPSCWLFPSEAVVRGFFGTGTVFVVGDQPSTSDWPEHNPNRRLFYDTLASVGLANAHITDIYKRRGAASGLRSGKLPDDFE